LFPLTHPKGFYGTEKYLKQVRTENTLEMWVLEYTNKKMIKKRNFFDNN